MSTRRVSIGVLWTSMRNICGERSKQVNTAKNERNRRINMKQILFSPMRYLLSTLFLLCNLFLVSAQSVTPDNKSEYLFKSESHAQIDSVMNKYAGEGFSGSVLVLMKDKKIINKSYGFANESTKTKNTSQTCFNVASISKLFTAAAILKLESEGKLKTGDLLNKYFGEMAGQKNTATIQDLLCHTAGLVKRGTSLNYSNRDSLIASVKRAPMESLPGREYRYTNVGYSLLAAIVEISSGISYEKYLLENIIRPAGQLNIGHAWEKRMLSLPTATGYNEKGVAEPADASNWGDKGASSLVMTPNDLYKWLKALNEGKIITKSQLVKMLFDFNKGNESYAFHKEILTDSTKVFWKGGGHPGFESQLVFYPQKETVIIFFINKNIGLRKKIFPELRKLVEASFD